MSSLIPDHKTKVILVTGGSRGIGSAVAREFGRQGCRVYVGYRTEQEKAEVVCRDIRGAGGEGQPVKADISRSDEVRRMVGTVAAESGGIDVLVHCAAVARDRSILRMSDEEWDTVVRTDLDGSFYVLRECGKSMMKRKQGAIIMISSIAGERGAPGAANYAAAKAGVSSLVKSAARELGRFNIRVNGVLPGFHLTDMGLSVPPEYVERARRESPLGVTTDIDELTKFIVFLSGMTTVTGQIFNCDSRIT